MRVEKRNAYPITLVRVGTVSIIVLGSMLTFAGKPLWAAGGWLVAMIPSAWAVEKTHRASDKLITFYLVGVVSLAASVALAAGLCYLLATQEDVSVIAIPPIVVSLALTGVALLRPQSKDS